MSDWSKTLTGLHERLWRLLADGATGQPAARAVLATLGPDGGPRARMVVLRGADRDAGGVSVHTDLASDKIAELRADPRAELQLWDSGLALQLRLRGEIRIQTGDPVFGTWRDLPDTTRLNYGVTPAPGTPIPAPDAYDRTPDRAKFAVLALRIDEIDAVHLAPDYHRRALFSRKTRWSGTWLAP